MSISTFNKILFLFLSNSLTLSNFANFVLFGSFLVQIYQTSVMINSQFPIIS